MKPVSTATGPAGVSRVTVLEWPPTRSSFSKTVTLCLLASSQAAAMPEMPVPMTAMSRGEFAMQLGILAGPRRAIVVRACYGLPGRADHPAPGRHPALVAGVIRISRAGVGVYSSPRSPDNAGSAHHYSAVHGRFPLPR